ncbi:GNAT family N-acetyltransferase [Streptomyces tsukubensis]|uniref:GNAT family N-acetyltransferase n=1 Tax=Streptomyces tsukubensis TaxID=83656 RepID=A0A1V4A491_9ACTN|nr:GNAT family protein [Streptomyces tsukubensis]OON75392.1 GNAT family N-acetyltransferase [Streptomyces tsukubensis]QFR94975.1 GNAT family N-acetyltransferase [Streptomyces tsukubensis]
MQPIDFTAGPVTLREFAAGDVAAVFAVYGDAAATRHLSFEPRTEAETRAIVARAMGSAPADPRTEYGLAVTRTDGGGLIGFGRLALDPHQPRGATMGFALRPDTWGHGYGTATVRALLGLAFGPLSLHRVWGARSPLNEASAATMARAGMVEEGRIREHIQKGGQWRDSVVHAILDREWARQRDLTSL